MTDDDDDTQDYVRPCPQCEYHKNRAARWRAEAYKQGGSDVIELPWVGLTDEEIEMYYACILKVRKKDIMPGDQKVFAKTIELALRKKNS